MNTADIKAGTTYRFTLPRADGAVLVATVNEIGAPIYPHESRVYYTNAEGVRGVSRLSDFAATHALI